MSNKILLSALNVGLESVDTPIDELYEDLAQTSADLTIEQSIEAEREIDEFSERLDIVREMVAMPWRKALTRPPVSWPVKIARMPRPFVTST